MRVLCSCVLVCVCVLLCLLSQSVWVVVVCSFLWVCVCVFFYKKYVLVCCVCDVLCDVVWCARRCGVSVRAGVCYLMCLCAMFVFGWLMLYGVVWRC